MHVIKSFVFVMTLFAVLQIKKAEETQDNNQTYVASHEEREETINEDEININGRKYSGVKRKNVTYLAVIQSEKIAYEKLKKEIAAYRKNKHSERFLIYPGTLWCGTGDIAWSSSDLGWFRRVDMCCRDHDHCPNTIAPWSIGYGLTNDALVEKMLCSCEEKFMSCLKAIGTTVARDIGNIYFNVIGNQCFKEEYPIVTCKLYYTGDYYKRCREYELDTSKSKKYQFFDVPLYR